MLIQELLKQKDDLQVETVPSDYGLLELASLFSRTNLGCVIVSNDGEELIGIVTESDMVKVISQSPMEIGGMVAADIMTTKIVVSRPEENISAVLEQMTKFNIRHIPVVDNGKLVTIIGMRDLQIVCEHLGQLARTDSLTGLPNRREFMKSINAEFSRYHRFGTPFSVAILDIDFFKKINDEHGHAAGDGVLVKFSKILTARLRAYDLSARIGGEEFGLLFPNTDLDNAIIICESLSEEIRKIELLADSGTINCTASFGLTTVNSNFDDVQALLKYADELLYDAKEQGRDRVIGEVMRESSFKKTQVDETDLDVVFFN